MCSIRAILTINGCLLLWLAVVLFEGGVDFKSSSPQIRAHERTETEGVYGVLSCR